MTTGPRGRAVLGCRRSSRAAVGRREAPEAAGLRTRWWDGAARPMPARCRPCPTRWRCRRRGVGGRTFRPALAGAQPSSPAMMASVTAWAREACTARNGRDKGPPVLCTRSASTMAAAGPTGSASGPMMAMFPPARSVRSGTPVTEVARVACVRVRSLARTCSCASRPVACSSARHRRRCPVRR
jgi:hypothetical protein